MILKIVLHYILFEKSVSTPSFKSTDLFEVYPTSFNPSLQFYSFQRLVVPSLFVYGPICLSCLSPATSDSINKH